MKDGRAFKVGDRVVATNLSDTVLFVSTVTKVQKYQRRTKVTIANGDAFDDGGLSWKRGGFLSSRVFIRHERPGDVEHMERVKRVSLLCYQAVHLSPGDALLMTDDEQKFFLDTFEAIKKRRNERGEKVG